MIEEIDRLVDENREQLEQTFAQKHNVTGRDPFPGYCHATFRLISQPRVELRRAAGALGVG